MRYRIRQSWTGKLIVQVEQIRNHMDNMGGTGYYDEYQTKRWVDAGTDDITAVAAILATPRDAA